MVLVLTAPFCTLPAGRSTLTAGPCTLTAGRSTLTTRPCTLTVRPQHVQSVPDLGYLLFKAEQLFKRCLPKGCCLIGALHHGGENFLSVGNVTEMCVKESALWSSITTSYLFSCRSFKAAPNSSISSSRKLPLLKYLSPRFCHLSTSLFTASHSVAVALKVVTISGRLCVCVCVWGGGIDSDSVVCRYGG